MAEEGVNVEVGPNHFPLMTYLREDLLDGNKAVYVDALHQVAVDLKKDTDNTRVDIWDINARGMKGIPLVGDGAHLPLPNQSVRLIFAANFVCSNDQAYMEEGSLHQPEVPSVSEIAKDWSQKLENNGRVVLIETYTPQDVNKDVLIEQFKQHGLQLNESYTGLEMSKIFRNHPHAKNTVRNAVGGSYALVFQKVSP